MLEAGFSESQLQQATNTAFTRYIFEETGDWIFTSVPSLIAEFDLGWDSAFYLPWTSTPPEPDHGGCNFFVQYKLSGKLTSPSARQWQYWKSEYLRFKIPHAIRRTSSGPGDSYHQWDRLKELADRGNPTFYATNAMLDNSELRDAFSAGTLLSYVPFLDVRKVADPHRYVTFTEGSKHFLLHSEKSQVAKDDISTVVRQVRGIPTISLDEANRSLLGQLREIADRDEKWIADLQLIARMSDQVEQNSQRSLIKRMYLSSFVRKHIGVDLNWLSHPQSK